ncbi:hypothetical protein BDV40DRAFT_131235 [Aspergillus tamarii]|uniref:Uncharacterized protein n=1 Tax=Aspergillus tamarii TaxID=41984 RepID=A0A5N6VBA2_ASPTM|nr:hypothetical protein BDV40DRAFT_131235 [Aspergillus tamarii]
MDRASGWGIMRDFNGGSGWTALGFVGDQWIVMSLGYGEAYGQGRAGYGGQEENRGALDGSEDAQGGGSGIGGADVRMGLRFRIDYHWRGIYDCYSRIEYHEHAIYDLRRQMRYYYDTRIECYVHTISDHDRKIAHYRGMKDSHFRALAELENLDLISIRMNLHGARMWGGRVEGDEDTEMD